MVLRFINGYLLRHHELKNEELWVDNGKIIDPLPFKEQTTLNVTTIDLNGLIISPGFIDLQVNGAFDVDFINEPEKIVEVSQKITRYGITSFLPTLISSSKETYRKILPSLPTNENGANILGWHIEGPFLNSIKAGAHCHETIFEYNQEIFFEQIVDTYGNLDHVKMVTLAPELPGMLKAISELKKQGIVVAAGHTLAKSDLSLKSFEAGVSMVTHLFNAMPFMEQREPGLVGAVLDHNFKEPLYYSLIVDKVHVHPIMVALAWKANSEACILVSDAISALGSERNDSRYTFGRQSIQVKNNEAHLKGQKTLAGGVTPLNVCLKNLVDITHCSLIQALETVTLKPAKLLNLSKKGQLLPGFDADFTIIDSAFSISMTFVNGSLCYSAPGLDKRFADISTLC